MIGRAGVERVLHLDLSEAESDALRQSAVVFRGVLDELDGIG